MVETKGAAVVAGSYAGVQVDHEAHLRRALTLPLLTLYGLGVTIGAGIYVLVGVTVSRAGVHAPITFIIAGTVVAFTCLSYAELSTRFPVSAGEAEYIQRGFGSRPLAVFTGLLLVASSIVSSAAISIGAVAYVRLFISVPEAYLVATLVLLLMLVAIWGIVESISIAALFTLIEIGGLAMVVWFGSGSIKDPSLIWKAFTPGFELHAWTGIAAGSLLAFFAFVGFEDIVNVAEEVHEPNKTLPRAIFLTLVGATFIYIAVVTVMVAAVPVQILSGAKAPLALVFQNKPGYFGTIFNLIAIVATVNGVLIQIIMASRVIYGLGRQGNLPAILAYVSPRFKTPLRATVLVAALVLLLALTAPIARLAEMTSQAVLAIFILVNGALLALRIKTPDHAGDHFRAPAWAPLAGLISSILLLATTFIQVP